MVAVRLADLVTPLRNGGLPGGDCRPALVIGGTGRIRAGEPVVFCKIVAVAPAQVRRDGRVQAKGSPVHHATLGPLEEWLEEQAGPGVIDGIAERAVLREQYVKGERERLLARAFMIRRNRPLKTGAIDGTLIRVPDTPANRAMYGSVGTGDDSSPFPQLRGLPMTDASTRGLLGMPHGPAGTDKAAAEQKLLDTALREFPHLFTTDRIWIMDRNYPGAARIARLTARTHVLIRLKSDIPLKKTSPILRDGSYLAEISGDGVTMTVRVIEYWVTVEGQEVPELFCLVTDLMDITEYPALELAGLYKWRWDGSETALREVKASLDGAGPSAGPMLRSGSPGLVRQELAAWAAGNEMTRGVARAAAAAAAPARKGRRAGQRVQAREISHGRARRAIIAAIRTGKTSCTALTRELAKHRTVIDRNRHRPRKAKCASTFPRAGRTRTATRTAAAVITLAT